MGENRLKLQQESWRLDIRKSFLVQEHMKMEHGVLCSLPGRSGPERSGSANSARSQGSWGEGPLDEKWEKHPVSGLSSRELVARRTQRSRGWLPAPRSLVGQKSRGSGRVQTGVWTEVGVGPLRHWTAENKQTSLCSQPWPPPGSLQDVCFFSAALSKQCVG